MWLARDKSTNILFLYPYDEPKKLEKTGIFMNVSQRILTIPIAIRILEYDDTYKDITWENSPVELTYKI